MRRSRRCSPRRSPGTLVAALLCALLAGLLPAARATAAARPAAERATTADQAATYHNPLTAGVVDTFPDPVMIRGKDGLWYAYGTQNPVFQSKGEDGERMLPILRSADLAHWEYAGEVFTPETKPGWHAASPAAAASFVDAARPAWWIIAACGAVILLLGLVTTGQWAERTTRHAAALFEEGKPTGQTSANAKAP
ncbi:hypothetical protein ACWEWX_19635 [Streptomyces asiaticus]